MPWSCTARLPDQYWTVVKRGVDDAAALTGAQVQYISPQVFDEVEHARLIDAAVASKPDGIAVSIADADAMRGPVTAALAAGIPVVNLDSGEVPGEEMGVTLYVGTVSEYDSGKKAGERLAKDGVLKVVCINHEVGNTSLDDRCRGLNDGLAPARRRHRSGRRHARSRRYPAPDRGLSFGPPRRPGRVRHGRRRREPADPDVPGEGAVRQIQALHLRHRARGARLRSSPARWNSAWTPSST